MADRRREPIELGVRSRMLAPSGYGPCQPPREGGMCGCDEPDDLLWPPSVLYLDGGFLPLAVPAGTTTSERNRA